MTLAWAVWAGVALLGFAVLETWALVRRFRDKQPGGTLSELLRRLLGVEPSKPWRVVGVAGFLAALVVFASHIVLGWP